MNATCPPCNHNCNQGRKCVGSGSPGEPAAVATFRPTARRTCLELGVCQGHVPPCPNCNGHSATTDERTGQRDDPEQPDAAEEAGYHDVWNEITYWGSHIAVGEMTVAAVFMAAGFLYSRFGG